jgi:hypothetical protein
VLIESCGHVPHREQLERVLREVTQFLTLGGATPETNP